VDCFYEGPNFLAINPDECIDCGICVPECPVDAIVADTDSTIDVEFWRDLNARLSSKWPVITIKKAAPDDAAEWKDVLGKLDFLKE
jgi:ferredoxin